MLIDKNNNKNVKEKLSRVKTLLNELKIPVAYGKFNNKVNLPFVAYKINDFQHFYCDNTNYFVTYNIVVNLYTENTEFTIAEQLEDLLLANGYTFTKNLNYSEEQQMYVYFYEFTLV